jgi:SAM-dependent methyltransferase
MDISRELRLQPRVSEEQFDRWILAYLRHAPLSLSVRELNRLIAMQALGRTRTKTTGPILDVGCGDGFWWTQLQTDGQQIFGIDVSEGEVTRAAEHIHAALCDVSRERPFPDQRFSEIVGNCSLEHVRDIYAALSNIRAAAADDARLVLFVPARDWAYQGLTQRTLLRHAPRVAMLVSGAMNGFFQHWHLYDVEVWERLLEASGFTVMQSFGLGSARSELLFRLFLPESLLEFVARSLIGHYPSKLLRFLPDPALRPLGRLLRWALADPFVEVDAPTAYEYVLVAKLA